MVPAAQSAPWRWYPAASPDRRRRVDRPDHVIVGSGINTLVCAAILAGKGAKVLYPYGHGLEY